MKAWRVLAVSVFAAACAARAAGPPDLVVDRTACSHCGMLVSEPIYAAAFQAPGADGRVFDDIGCLLAAARQQPAAGLRVWFHDATDGRWIDGPSAVFVVSPAIRTPMGGGVMAFDDERDAADAAARYRGEVVPSLALLLAKSGGVR
jgi:copper chaperone NosL